MDEPSQATSTAATNPFLSGNFAPVEAETTCFDLEVPQPAGRLNRTSPKIPTEARPQPGTTASHASKHHSSILGKDPARRQDGHAFMASAETNRNSFSVAPLAD
jgi:hypothetical protein